MEFDRIIVRQMDANRIVGVEQAVQQGRKTWSFKRIFREMKVRLTQSPWRDEFDVRRLDRAERRYVDDFQREYNEDPLIQIERQLNTYCDQVRR